MTVQKHYNLNDEEYNSLIKSGITVQDLFKAIPLFDPYSCGCEVGKMSLMLYVDNKGDFNSKPQFPHKKIAKAVFNCLDIKSKIEIAEYIDFLENGEEDD